MAAIAVAFGLLPVRSNALLGADDSTARVAGPAVCDVLVAVRSLAGSSRLTPAWWRSAWFALRLDSPPHVGASRVHDLKEIGTDDRLGGARN